MIRTLVYPIRDYKFFYPSYKPGDYSILNLENYLCSNKDLLNCLIEITDNCSLKSILNSFTKVLNSFEIYLHKDCLKNHIINTQKVIHLLTTKKKIIHGNTSTKLAYYITYLPEFLATRIIECNKDASITSKLMKCIPRNRWVYCLDYLSCGQSNEFYKNNFEEDLNEYRVILQNFESFYENLREFIAQLLIDKPNVSKTMASEAASEYKKSRTYINFIVKLRDFDILNLKFDDIVNESDEHKALLYLTLRYELPLRFPLFFMTTNAENTCSDDIIEAAKERLIYDRLYDPVKDEILNFKFIPF